MTDYIPAPHGLTVRTGSRDSSVTAFSPECDQSRTFAVVAYEVNAGDHFYPLMPMVQMRDGSVIPMTDVQHRYHLAVVEYAERGK